jgi:hypothetical protein
MRNLILGRFSRALSATSFANDRFAAQRKWDDVLIR